MCIRDLTQYQSYLHFVMSDRRNYEHRPSLTKDTFLLKSEIHKNIVNKIHS